MTTSELVWKCALGYHGCNPWLRNRYHLNGDHSECGWVPAESSDQGPEIFGVESSLPTHLISEAENVTSRNSTPESRIVTKRAAYKGKTGETLGCACGAQLSVVELHMAGSVIGAIDLMRVVWRRLHTGPACTIWKPWEGP